MNRLYKCSNNFPGGYCLKQTPCPEVINPNPIYGGCTDCLTYSQLPHICTPCHLKPGCYKYPATFKIYSCHNCGLPCNCPPKKKGLLECPDPPYSSKVHYLHTYAGLPPPSQLVPGYLNQGTDANFKTRWFPVTWGDLLCCANHFHMKETQSGVKLRDELLIHDDTICDDVCICCQNNLNRGERMRIISHGKRVRGAGDQVLACLRRKGKTSCNPCNCPKALNPSICRCS